MAKGDGASPLPLFVLGEIVLSSMPSRSASQTLREPTQSAQGDAAAERRWRSARLGLMLGGVAVAIAIYQVNAGVRDEIGRALAMLATGDGVAIGAYLQGFGIWAPVASLGLMVVQAVAAPVPAILVAFANGLAFGVLWGGLLTVAGQTLAAAVCFGMARALGRSPVEALAGKLGLGAADRWLSQWGARGIFLLRLAPGISFDVISYGAGLTGIGFRPFIVATAIGTAPQAFLYAYLIRESPQSAWLLFFGSWLAIGVLGSAAFVRRNTKRSGNAEDEAVGSTRVKDAADLALAPGKSPSFSNLEHPSSPTRNCPSSPALLPVRGEKGEFAYGSPRTWQGAPCADEGRMP